jgi:hypothetical protein
MEKMTEDLSKIKRALTELDCGNYFQNFADKRFTWAAFLKLTKHTLVAELEIPAGSSCCVVVYLLSFFCFPLSLLKKQTNKHLEPATKISEYITMHIFSMFSSLASIDESVANSILPREMKSTKSLEVRRLKRK